MKKKGPQRSQSRSALPGSSRKGLGKTTSLRFLTMRLRSRLTVSQTGSVSVSVSGPNPSEPMGTTTEPEPGANAESAAGLAAETMVGAEEEEEMGMEARGGEAGSVAGSTAAGDGEALRRSSISSMSERADEGWSGTVSPRPWGCGCHMAAGRRDQSISRRGGSASAG
jgi:hypothetical protein